MNKILRPPGAKTIIQRSGTKVAALLIVVREVLPDAPWWGLALIALAFMALEQVFAPSQPAEKP